MRETSAAAAAARAGVSVRDVDDVGELGRVASLFGEVWRQPDRTLPMSAHALAALRLSGNYVAGAFDATGELVGASVGWSTPPPERELHSHITGIARGREGRGVGLALKLHQRDFALSRSLETITWTFDPLVRRNAAFNLRTLAANVEAYLENVYGEMEDELNAGGESDRLLVAWHISAVVQPTAVEAAAGPVTRVETPLDIESLRLSAPSEAVAWRKALRERLAPLLAGGGRIVGFSERGEYLVCEANRS